MNTGLRRFILRLAVGLLAFFIGVGVSWAIGGLNPFQSSGTPSYKKRCGYQRSWSASSSEIYDHATTSEIHVYEGRSCKTKRMHVDIPPPPPPPPAAPATSGGS